MTHPICNETGCRGEPSPQQLLLRITGVDVSTSKFLMVNQVDITTSILTLRHLEAFDFGEEGNKLRDEMLQLYQRISQLNSDFHSVLKTGHNFDV